MLSSAIFALSSKVSCAREPEQGIEDKCCYLFLDDTKFATLERRGELELKYIPQLSRKALKHTQQITNEDL